MTDNDVLDLRVLESLPPEWPHGLLPRIREQIRQSGYKIIILDDDPTGTQTARDLPVLTRWSVAALRAELDSSYPAFFILTNSRSLTPEEACSLAREIGTNIRQASEQSGVRVALISRSDSTLRGHFPSEVDEMARMLDKQRLPYLLVPFFLEGGRYTINDVHYVREGAKLIPAARTPFARDQAFGFRESNLKQWVEEKTGGRIQAEQVVSIGLEDIRLRGPEAVARLLLAVEPDTACIVNAASYRDMEVVIAALLEVEGRGKEFLYRTAASFVRTRTGLDEAGGLLPADRLVSPSGSGGLFVIGSYVEKTSAQVKTLFEQTDITPVEAEVRALLDDTQRAAEIERVRKTAETALAGGSDVAIYTSRELVGGDDGASSLAIGRIVSDSLIAIVRGITVQPRYLVAKGGITSSDIATKALGVERAMVIGQALPGVPAWRLGTETRYPEMTYIIFPGNVGEADALATIKNNLQ